MTNFIFANNVSTTLAQSANAGATIMNLTSAQNLPSSIPAGTVMPLTLNDAATRLVYEIVYVTAISGTQLTVQRGMEGTLPQNWNVGDFASVNLTAGVQQAMSYGNNQVFGTDIGSANAYRISLQPALNNHVVGLPILWKAGHDNTTASTFNDGAGAANLVMPTGAQLPAGFIKSGGIYESVWDGVEFQVTSFSGIFVQGPPSSTAGHIPSFADTTGKLLQDGYAVGTAANAIPQLDSVGNLVTAKALTVTGTSGAPAGQSLFSPSANQLALATAGIQRLLIALGIQLGAPTGGDKGFGSINAALGFFVNGKTLGDGNFLASNPGFVDLPGGLILNFGNGEVPPSPSSPANVTVSFGKTIGVYLGVAIGSESGPTGVASVGWTPIDGNSMNLWAQSGGVLAWYLVLGA